MKNHTHIVGVLDKSGSMSSIRKSVIDGFNKFVGEQMEEGDNASATLVLFDSPDHSIPCIETVYENTPIKNTPLLTNEVYVPRGWTPLMDALGETIEKTGKALNDLPENERPDKVVFVVITDGYENASQTYTKDRIREMVTRQEEKYNWNFIFLGANMDAVKEGATFGVMAVNSASFSPDAASVGATYSNVSANLREYRNTGSSSSLKFTKEQRESMTNDFNPTGGNISGK